MCPSLKPQSKQANLHPRGPEALTVRVLAYIERRSSFLPVPGCRRWKAEATADLSDPPDLYAAPCSTG